MAREKTYGYIPFNNATGSKYLVPRNLQFITFNLMQTIQESQRVPLPYRGAITIVTIPRGPYYLS